ncbi:MAG: integrase arm-type DNA-binding domain-containing protein [Hydrogenophaga sp.]|uniref:tyrosine-type recombinase/integrase n=1 Tax=Hydrogenophaga sp. TaxID=1904254 RepID=UPI0026108012|nr:integrase arm-type DNA-binding domain-containing protein [Hydrogenophaga sp.]MCW5669760.1 integrase arm-type DNA-binding domain-containing protein [Hydrogenophaga sp.]
MALTDAACRNFKPQDKPKKLADERGLYLLVKAADAHGVAGKYWRFDFRYGGKRLTLALGVYPEVDLKTARQSRDDARALLREGRNPTAERAATKRHVAASAANNFKTVALDWHAVKSARWKQVTADKQMTHLVADVFPVIGHRPIAEITAPELLALFNKIVARNAAYTASRVREICRQVIAYAIATGRATYNPANDLRNTIAVPSVKHRPAITDKREFGIFLRDLASYESADRLTLMATKLALLTFVRSQELRYARWSEIDVEAREWRIPAARMKMGKGLNQAHIVPLAPQAIALLQEIKAYVGEVENVFPNNYGADGFMSENTIGRMLIRMGYQGKQTLHGFRASARSLLSERGWTVDALERQLDHAERNKSVAAYARSEHLVERRKIMNDWANLVDALTVGGNVVHLPQLAA